MQTILSKQDAINQLLENLNPEQKDSVLHTEGPLLVLAGAGTGKTRVLTTRLAYILHNELCLPENILAVTFTNKAAKEIGMRVSQMVYCTGSWLGTFHSIAAKILRENSEHVGLSSYFSIIDTSEQLQLIKNLLVAQNIDTKVFTPKIISGRIERWKDKNISPEHLSNNDIKTDFEKVAAEIYPTYQQELVKSNAVDFGDLLLYNNRIFISHPNVLSHYQNKFKYIMVDEYQDTNIAQYIWIRMLGSKHKNIFCVGDDDQSIYSWRGADISNILKFGKDFADAKIVRLERNYRSTNHILAAAGSVIKNNELRHDKTLWTENNGGDKVYIVACETDKQEASFVASSTSKIPLNNIAILVRASFQTRPFEDALMSNSIPYKIIGGLKFYERMEIRDAIAYLRLALNPGDNLAFERIINVPKRSIGSVTINMIREYARLNSLTIFDAIQNMCLEGIFKAKNATVLTNLTSMIQRWHERMKISNSYELTKLILQESGYLDMWKDEKTEEAKARLDNLNEMLGAVGEYPDIAAFIEHASLATERDVASDDNQVSIMTLHASKGLEFDMVFLTGWEEGLFPNQRALAEQGKKGLEEERRLAYVGMTRAKKHLVISYAKYRRMYKDPMHNSPSRFIEEIPEAAAVRVPAHQLVGFNSSGSIFNFIEKRQTKTYQQATQQAATIAPSDPYKVGNKVRHNKFGTGIIVRKMADNLEIMFYSAGLKTIKQSFIELE